MALSMICAALRRMSCQLAGKTDPAMSTPKSRKHSSRKVRRASWPFMDWFSPSQVCL